MRGATGSRVLLACALALALLLAGCGGGGSTTVINRTVTETTGGGAATTESTTPTTDTTPVTDTGTSEAPTRFVHLSAFQSPSGNIGCMIVAGTARCDIVKRSWSPPAHPAGCPEQVDFGQGLEVGRSGAGRFVCAGDTTLNPSAAKLPYGSASEAGAFVCVSRASGITCTNAGDGHGFFLSVQAYRAF